VVYAARVCKLRLQGTGGEVLLPQSRGEFGDASGGKCSDALKHIDQVVIRIDGM